MVWQEPASVPYCGPPPSPGSLWLSWNLDPILISGLAAVLCLYILGGMRLKRAGHGLTAGQMTAFLSGWLITTLALVSPLCSLSVSLFSARVGQHMVLSLLAAPLVATGRPVKTIAAALAGPMPRGRWLRPAPLLATAVFAMLLWFWHAPGPYATTFSSTLAYWSMHFTVFGGALWLWYGLLADQEGSMIRTVAGGVISSAQMGFLGALITLAPRAVYEPHSLTTSVWGLTQLQDQQFGGVIMWVPGGAIFLGLALLALWPAIAEPKADGLRAGSA